MLSTLPYQKRRPPKGAALFLILSIIGLISFMLLSLAAFEIRNQAVHISVEQWAQERLENIREAKDVIIPEAGDALAGDYDQMLVESLYYTMLRPHAEAQIASSDIWNLWEGGSDSLAAIAVGNAEGTRTAEGHKNPAWYGHDDPGNGVWNLGTFSYQHGASSPEEADQKQLARLKNQTSALKERAAAIGLEMSLEELVNGIDLTNQAPDAGIGEWGYADRLLEAKNNGLTGKDAIVEARSKSFLDPAHGFALNAPGLGNDMTRVRDDQRRRADRVSSAIAAQGGGISIEAENSQDINHMEDLIVWAEESGAMDILRNGLTKDPYDGSVIVGEEAFRSALVALEVCGWSDGCRIQPPEGTDATERWNAFAWEMGHLQGIKEADPPLEIETAIAGGEEFMPPANMNDPGVVLSSPFGPRSAPTPGASTYHRGLDIAGPFGTDVLAAAGGHVLVSGYRHRGYGHFQVVISHPNGYETFYGHNQGVYFPVGAEVNQGSRIAAMGSEGVSTGPHVHFEVNPKGGSQIDPCRVLSMCEPRV